MKLRIATWNKIKQQELSHALTDLPIEHGFVANTIADIQETGQTFTENAFLKAETIQHYYPDDIIIGEDSGLSIEVLAGFPGVKTARFIPGSDRERALNLFDRLKHYPLSKRKAAFHSVIAILFPDGSKSIATGTMRGWINRNEDKPISGYGSIFQLENRIYLEELSLQSYLALSHRQLALQQACYLIGDWLNQGGDSCETS
ncbi:non-canonical purine NTP pyrophosphatase [Amphibacillus sediminis]|uniref:non-canonical purine NTP pyrophosphatase n=1 Tax=Amphibacillus sediminis TaxID=360185 RepID=UPI0008379C42|nr:non-canonical purine NTP pyrophosphatase [Amphibacillus sediminis]